MPDPRQHLLDAEKIAADLFNLIEFSGLIVAGKTEHQLNTEIFELAEKKFGIKKYWHKRIVRSGKNTLYPYHENPPDLILQNDDILFFDFGPILEEWEADYGRTYVIGDDPLKHKLKNDIEAAWLETRDWFRTKTTLSGAECFHYATEKARQYNWTFGGEIAGHIIGKFPHEKLEAEIKDHYVHPENHLNMFNPDKNGNKREWILEIHFVNHEKEIGGFFEQLLT